MVSIEELKPRLDKVLESTGFSHTDLWQGIPMTESGYWRMLKKGSMDVRTLISILNIVKVPAGVLLDDIQPGAPVQVVSEPTIPYGISFTAMLQRLERLETEVRKLKEQQRPK